MAAAPQSPNPHVHPLVWLIVLRAAEKFNTAKNRYPGSNAATCLIDALDLSAEVRQLAQTTNVRF